MDRQPCRLLLVSPDHTKFEDKIWKQKNFVRPLSAKDCGVDWVWSYAASCRALRQLLQAGLIPDRLQQTSQVVPKVYNTSVMVYKCTVSSTIHGQTCIQG